MPYNPPASPTAPPYVLVRVAQGWAPYLLGALNPLADREYYDFSWVDPLADWSYADAAVKFLDQLCRAPVDPNGAITFNHFYDFVANEYASEWPVGFGHWQSGQGILADVYADGTGFTRRLAVGYHPGVDFRVQAALINLDWDPDGLGITDPYYRRVDWVPYFRDAGAVYHSFKPVEGQLNTTLQFGSAVDLVCQNQANLNGWCGWAVSAAELSVTFLRIKSVQIVGWSA